MNNTKFKLKPTARTAYLYADGHAVILHEKDDKQAGRVQWAEIIEKLDLCCRFEGRIVFGSLHWESLFSVVLQDAHTISVSEPSLKSGSDNTKARGIRVSDLVLASKRWPGRGELRWVLFPDIISGPITYQPDVCESYADVAGRFEWSGHHVSAVYHPRAPKPVGANQEAA